MHINFRGQEIHYSTRKDFWDVVESGKWEPETFDVLDKYIVSGKSFIDIGAWIGALSIYAGRLGANVYSLEPDPVAFLELGDNAWLNEGINISFYNTAISNKDGEAELNTNGEFGDSESSLTQRNVCNKTVNVPTQTLASFIESEEIKNICLIKIDIEGGEEIVIDKYFVRDLAALNFPVIYLSMHPDTFISRDNTIKRIYDLLSPHYKITSHDKEYTPEEFKHAMTVLDHSFLLLKR